SDSVATSETVTLTETLTPSDSVATSETVTLTETLTPSDSVATSETVTLTETLTPSDSVATSETVTLTETLTPSDSVATSETVTLTETLTPSDVITTNAAQSATLSETLTSSDVVSTSRSQTVVLLESLTITDVVSLQSLFTRILEETLSFSDNFTFAGSLNIRVVDDDQLKGGASFTISPNPLTGTGSLNITDNGINDVNATSGEIRITSVPFDDYTVTMTTIPTGYVVTIDQTSAPVCCVNVNPLTIFTLIDENTDLSTADSKKGSSAPLLNSTGLNILQGFNAVIVNSQTQTTISKTNQLPEITTVGVNNPSGKTTATSSQSNIKYVKDWSKGIKGSDVINSFKMQPYVLPTNKSSTAVIPVFVSTETTTHQVISASIKKITSGQQMILPIQLSLIPSFGGLLKLDITSKDSSSSVGVFDKDWIVIETDDDHINSPTLASSGITNELELEIDVKYRYEEDSVGFNYNDENNFASKPQMTVLVPKPTSSDIITLANGCADVEAHTLVGTTWTSGIDKILSNTPSEKSGFCDVVVESDHYSKKSISSKRSTSSAAGESSAGTSGLGGGGGRTSAGASVSGASVGFGGILSTPLAINEVSYDKCNENMARIIVSSDADTPPAVKLATSKSGIVYATLAEVQPYEDLNKLTSIDRYLYEVPISSDETFLMIVVTEEKGTTKNVVQASVRLLSCEGTTVIVEIPDELPEIVEGIPRIFDTTIQIANGTRYSADLESEFLYIDNQDMKVSAIIDSAVPLQRVELRSITMGQTEDQYVGINMNVEALPISNSTYLVSADIPSFVMSEPGMQYWLHIIDENDNRSESKHYNIGVKPTIVSDISVEMDVPNIIPSGSLIKPELYIFNDDAPSYGIVSLVVDGKVVSKKSQIFGIGQTQVIFNWNAPSSDGYSTLDLQGRVDLYDHSTVTVPAQVSIHPKTIAISAYEMESLQVIEKDGQVLADPALIYASNSASDLRFRVTDPQGQCIIGGTEECLINDNTRGNRGGLESIPYGDQILRVRYSGADNMLERFSITSIDPIVGQWIVALETEDGFIPQAHAADDPLVKVKYRYHSEIITVKSQ
ncbi:MAG: hypothetical protein K5798_11105, partial [Nitrosopumilus sp.]|uniref:hypothetical protein n=1 Tax=Nitrosopumilus sp. TaxID=2024843 RepID=UPI00242AED32